MTRFKHTLALAGATLLVGGCATTGGARKAPAATGGATATRRAPGLSGADRRAFDDGVAAYKEQKQAGVLDLQALARRWKEVTQDAPDVAEGWYNLGVVEARLGHLDAAAQAYTRALEKKPSLSAAAENLGVLYQNQGKVQQAASAYQRILKWHPDSARARVRLAELYREQGDATRAVSFARAALVREPDLALAYKVLMRVAVDHGKPALTRLLALKAQRRSSQDPEIPYRLAQVDLQEHDEDQAIADLRQSVKLDPHYLPARRLLLEIAKRHQDWATAAAELTAILKANPKDAAGFVDLGVAYRGLGKPKLASTAYQQALKLDPKLPEAHYDLGLLAFQVRHDNQGAIQEMKQFIAARSGVLPPDHPAYKIIKQAQQNLALQAEAKKMEAEAKRQEAARKRKEAAAKQKALEAQIKAAKGQGGATATPGAGNAKGAPATRTGKAPAKEAAPGAASGGDSGKPGAAPAVKATAGTKAKGSLDAGPPAEDGEPKDGM